MTVKRRTNCLPVASSNWDMKPGLGHHDHVQQSSEGLVGQLHLHSSWGYTFRTVGGTVTTGHISIKVIDAYLLKIWEKSIPTPIGVPNIIPGVEALLVATIPHHAIDQGPTTNALAHRNMTTDTIEVSLRHSIKAPFVKTIRLKSDVIGD